MAPRLRALAGAGLIVLLTVGAYSASLGGGFLIDDDMLVTDSPLIKAADGVSRFWSTTEPYDYWPVTNTTLWLEWRLWGMHAAGYRITNLFLHVVESLLLWKVLQRLSIPGAFLAALLFAVHPVNVESVAWIAQRKNLLAMLFLLLSILAYLESEASSRLCPPIAWQGQRPAVETAGYPNPSLLEAGSPPRHFAGLGGEPPSGGLALGSRRIHSPDSSGAGPTIGGQGPSSPSPSRPTPPLADPWYWLTLMGFVFAMLSKISAAVLPPVLVVIIAWRRPLTRRDLVRTAPFFLLAGVLICVNVWFRAHTLEIPDPGGFAERLLGGVGVMWFYLYKALFPVNLVFIYPRWDIQIGQLQSWLPLLAAAVVMCMLWRYRLGWSRAPLFAWGYFCVALVPAMGFTERLVVADHYQHVALIGVVVLVAAGWARWRHRARGLARWVPNAAAVAVVGAFALLTARQSRLYSDNVTLFQAAVERNPDSAMAQHNVGYVLLKAGRLEEAREHLEQALRIEPGYTEAHKILGSVLAQGGQLQGAIGHFQQALRLRPDDAGVHNNLGTLLRETGRSQEAMEHLQQALRLKPDFPEAHCNLAKALLENGRPAEAIEHFRQAVRFKADFPEARTLLAAALASSKTGGGSDEQPPAPDLSTDRREGNG